MLLYESNTSTNVRHWYEQPLKARPKQSTVQRDSELLLLHLHTWLHQHITWQEEVFKGKCLHDTQITGVRQWLGSGGFHFPSILIKYFDPWTTCSGLNGLSRWPDRFIHSQCNYWQTNNQRTVSKDSLPAWVQLSQWNPNRTFTTSRSPLAP